MNAFKKISEWYASQCDGEWEHEYGVSITTIDNPGWLLKVDLAYTDYYNLEIEYQLYRKSNVDWYGMSCEEGVFSAGGDPTKLEFLIELFLKTVNVKS